MALTLTATDAADLRAQVLDIFPGLAATPIRQASDGAAKALIGAWRIGVLTSDIGRLETERQALRDSVADVTEDNVALQRELSAARASLASIGSGESVDERITTLTGERHQALTELDAAQETERGNVITAATIADTIGLAQEPISLSLYLLTILTRCKAIADDLTAARAEIAALKAAPPLNTFAGPPEPTTPKRTRATKPAALGDLAPTAFSAKRPTVPTGALPDNFTSLPPAASLADGASVVVCIPSDTSPTGWATPVGLVVRKFPDTDRYEVDLGRGKAPAFVTSEHIRGLPVDAGDALEASIAARVAEQRALEVAGVAMEAPAEVEASETPAPPTAALFTNPEANAAVFGEPTTDRLITRDEQLELGAYAKDLDLNGADMAGIISRNFNPRTKSGEVMASELGKLRELMRLEGQVPF